MKKLLSYMLVISAVVAQNAQADIASANQAARTGIVSTTSDAVNAAADAYKENVAPTVNKIWDKVTSTWKNTSDSIAHSGVWQNTSEAAKQSADTAKSYLDSKAWSGYWKKLKEWNPIKVSKLPELKRANPAIFDAILSGNISTLKKLINEKNDLNVESFNGITPLMIAAQQGNVEMVKLLLTEGANPNYKDDNGNTLLDYARHGKYNPTLIKVIKEAQDYSKIS